MMARMPQAFRNKAAVLVAVAVLVSACASPQDRCVQAAGAELRSLDTEIAQTEQALARGYRVLPAQDGVTKLRLCAWPREPVLFCTERVQTPRAQSRQMIDPAKENVRLQQLRAQRAALVIQTADRIAACGAQ